jgi:hypothetical protein
VSTAIQTDMEKNARMSADRMMEPNAAALAVPPGRLTDTHLEPARKK